MAAQDVRTLVSFDGGRTLAPFRGAFEAKSDPLVGYLAVKHAGVWADMFVTAASRASDVQRRVQAALRRACSTLPSRARAPAALHAKAIEALAPLRAAPGAERQHRAPHRPLARRRRRAHARDGRHALAPGEVYTLHVGAHEPTTGGALTSATIAITATGADLLHRSPAPVRP